MIVTRTKPNPRSDYQPGGVKDVRKLAPLLTAKGFTVSICSHNKIHVQTDGYQSVVKAMDAFDEMGLEYSLHGLDECVESIAVDLALVEGSVIDRGQTWISASRTDQEIRLRVLKAYEIYDRVVRSVQYQ